MLGAVLAPRLARWLGVGKAIVWSIAIGGIGPALIGGFLGGVLGSIFVLRGAVWIAAIGQATAFLWLLPSPVPQMKEVPRPLEDMPAAVEPMLGATVEAPTA